MYKWIKWLAQDLDGSVWGFEAEPHRHDSGWYENEVGRYIKLGNLANNSDWPNSLTHVSQISKSQFSNFVKLIE